MIRAITFTAATLLSYNLSTAAIAAPINGNSVKIVVIDKSVSNTSASYEDPQVLVYTEDEGRIVRVVSPHAVTRPEAEAMIARAKRSGEHARLDGLRQEELGRQEADRGKSIGEVGRREAEGARVEAAQAHAEGERAAVEGRRAANEAQLAAARARAEAEDVTAELR